MDDSFRSYLVLGVTPEATPEEIKRAYRRLVRQWHPDRMSQEDRRRRAAEERLRQINRAYETLKAGQGASGPGRPLPPGHDPFGWRQEMAAQVAKEGEEDAGALYARALRLHFEGVRQFQSGQLREAVSSLNQSVFLVQNNPEAYRTLGRAYRRLSQPAKAEAAYREAARIEPDSADTHYELGETYLLLGDRAAAERQAERLDRLDTELAGLLRESISRAANQQG